MDCFSNTYCYCKIISVMVMEGQSDAFHGDDENKDKVVDKEVVSPEERVSDLLVPESGVGERGGYEGMRDSGLEGVFGCHDL